MKKSNLRINLIYNLMYRVVTVLSPLIVTPKIARVFGVDYLGVKSFTYSIVYYFAIVGVLGLDMYGQRKIALCKDDIAERSQSFWTIFFTRFSLMFICIFLYTALILVLKSSTIERIVFFCWIIYLIREMINPAWFLQGMEKYRFLSILSIISQVLYVICTIVFVNKKDDLPLYIVFYCAIPLFISLCYFPYVFQNVRKCSLAAKDMLISVKESIVYFIPTIATAIYSMVDKTMLGAFDQQRVFTGLYDASERLVKVALALSSASFPIMRTRMTYLFGKKDFLGFQNTARKFMSFSLMLCWPIMMGIMGISKEFVPLFFGSGYNEVISLSYVFALVIPCLTISGLLQAIFIFPYGLQKTMDIYYGIIVSVNIVMNLILISLFKTTGAIIASIFSEFLLAVILIVRAKKEIPVKYIFSGSIKYIISSVIMFLLMRLLSRVLNTSSIVKVILEFIVGVVVYFIMCIILRDEFVIKHVKDVIRKFLPKVKE